MSLNERVTSVARRALQALKNRVFSDLVAITCRSKRALIDELASQSYDQTSWFFASNHGRAVEQWNGVLSLDVLYECGPNEPPDHAKVLFAKETNSKAETFFVVRLCEEDGDWRFEETKALTAEELRNSTAISITCSSSCSAKDLEVRRRSSWTETSVAHLIPPRMFGSESSLSISSANRMDDSGIAAENDLSVDGVGEERPSIGDNGIDNEIDNENDDYWEQFPKQITENEYELEIQNALANQAVGQALDGVWQLAQMLNVESDQFMAAATKACSSN
eukprot:Ihof_evm1s48 gene=Ihof_evmTU1s48